MSRECREFMTLPGSSLRTSRQLSGHTRDEDVRQILLRNSPDSLFHDLPDTFLGAVGIINLGEYEVALNSSTIWRTILWTCYSTSIALFDVLLWKAA
jgi:hypothetical protein